MRILLNWFPPATISTPSPSMSILKSYLRSKGIEVDVIYWNLILDEYCNKFINSDSNEYWDIELLFPFFVNIYEEYSNNEPLTRLAAWYKKNRPELLNISVNAHQHDLIKYATQLRETIDVTLKEILSKHKYDLVGIPAKLYQFVPSALFAKIIKSHNANLPLVLGGLGNKKEAEAMMQSFEFIDYAIWGEGEHPLHSLCSFIENKIEITEVPNLLYRDNDNIKATILPNRNYLNIDTLIPDYSDYYKIVQGSNNKKNTIPIEGGRGCHWRKCKFCFLNTGYRYREKNADSIIDEIRSSISKYNITSFIFLDNDIIGKDENRFNDLLDGLIKIREEVSGFEILNGEIITKGVDINLIRKMSLAGFLSVQIGYESLSDSLLNKTNKKNTVSSNLFFVKWALEFGIHVDGANLLMNLIGETEKEVEEILDNLHYLRFYIDTKAFKHNFSPLVVMSSSKYYKELIKDGEIEKYIANPLIPLLPSNFINKNYSFDIFAFSKTETNKIWFDIMEVEKHYLMNNYSYLLYRSNNNAIEYLELLNNERIKSFSFKTDKTENHWEILYFCNEEIRSIDEIQNHLMSNGFEDFAEETVVTCLNELNDERLLYSSPDKVENISIINTNKIT